MRKVRAFGLRILGLFDGRRSDDDFSAELESHSIPTTGSAPG
jgi:hypothetical protein